MPKLNSTDLEGLMWDCCVDVVEGILGGKEGKLLSERNSRRFLGPSVLRLDTWSDLGTFNRS